MSSTASTSRCSVVAQQLLTIQNAMKSGVTKFNFEGRDMKLVHTVFITMNPATPCRELPDNPRYSARWR